jgi:hypothetical protein
MFDDNMLIYKDICLFIYDLKHEAKIAFIIVTKKVGWFWVLTYFNPLLTRKASIVGSFPLKLI